MSQHTQRSKGDSAENKRAARGSILERVLQEPPRRASSGAISERGVSVFAPTADARARTQHTTFMMSEILMRTRFRETLGESTKRWVASITTTQYLGPAPGRLRSVALHKGEKKDYCHLATYTWPSFAKRTRAEGMLRNLAGRIGQRASTTQGPALLGTRTAARVACAPPRCFASAAAGRLFALPSSALSQRLATVPQLRSPVLALMRPPSPLFAAPTRSIIVVDVHQTMDRGIRNNDPASDRSRMAEIARAEEIALSQFNRLVAAEVSRGTLKPGRRGIKRFFRAGIPAQDRRRSLAHAKYKNHKLKVERYMNWIQVRACQPARQSFSSACAALPVPSRACRARHKCSSVTFFLLLRARSTAADAASHECGRAHATTRSAYYLRPLENYQYAA